MTRSSTLLQLVATLGLAVTASSAEAAVEPPPPADVPVDVIVPETRPPSRELSIEWNPLSLIVGKISANVVISLDALRALSGRPASKPLDHHALVLSPFYISTTTWPIYTYSDQGSPSQLPQQKFSGFGGELGYRYYTGIAGPRGFFVGPSFILAGMNAKAQDGGSTDYLDLGVALDVGYEMLIANCVSLSFGVGAQYTAPDKTIPNQQFPADMYANASLAPRALASIGWAF